MAPSCKLPEENCTATKLPFVQQKCLPPKETEPRMPPYTMLTEKEKIFAIIIASFPAFISPVSASIYYPALNSLARDLNVTVSTINLTITVYMVSHSASSTWEPKLN